jgi:hypothetical protein
MGVVCGQRFALKSSVHVGLSYAISHFRRASRIPCHSIATSGRYCLIHVSNATVLMKLSGTEHYGWIVANRRSVLENQERLPSYPGMSIEAN